MRMESFSSLLQGGDRRSIGRADEAVESVRRAPRRFDELWACLAHGDPVVRMRAVDALEKITRFDAAPLACHKQALLANTFDDGTPEVRWHLIAMLRRVPLDAAEVAGTLKRLDRLLHVVSLSGKRVRVQASRSHPATLTTESMRRAASTRLK